MQVEHLVMFQYISCYSLSNIGMGSYQPGNVSIHLMLLFIRNHSMTAINYCKVSIHLMLLFIVRKMSEKEKRIVFQYISYYSLSLVAGAVFIL